LYSLLPLTTRRKVKAMIVRTVAALCSSQRQEGGSEGLVVWAHSNCIVPEWEVMLQQ
jgi:hypothetical protein